MSSPSKGTTLPQSESKPSTIRNNKHQGGIKKKSKHERLARKRSKSFSGCVLSINPKPVLPSKFLLGGNINDPLNLNSLQNEDINRAMNAVTPKSSPLPTPPRRKMPIEVISYPNSSDPLHLLDCENEQQYEEHISPMKKGRKKRLKKRRTMSASVEGSVPETTHNCEAKTPEISMDSAKIPADPEASNAIDVSKDSPAKPSKTLSFDFSKDKREKLKRSFKFDEGNAFQPNKKFRSDKIVSPVVPQPGARLIRSNSVKLPRPRRPNVDNKMPTFKPENKRFQFGNYNRYYGYRNPNNDTDYRLKVFSYHSQMFTKKDILDIGCNIGHITLSIARDFGARTVTGIDIDPKLILIARKNVKHYVKTAADSNSPSQGIDKTPDSKREYYVGKSGSEFFPISLPILYGPIDIPGFCDTNKGSDFPNNVVFKQCNYVLEDEALLALEQPQFDVILCLSVTKWIHLNWGDSGLKLAFKRMYEQLRPGGKLILEPQNWSGYKRKKNLTETIYKNYNAIEFFPDKFRDYLLSSTVGFAKCEILGVPQHKSFGFKRPIQVFTKSTMFPSERVEVTPHNPVYAEVNATPSDDEPRQEHIYPKLLQPMNRYHGSEPEDLLDTNESRNFADGVNNGDVTTTNGDNSQSEKLFETPVNTDVTGTPE